MTCLIENETILHHIHKKINMQKLPKSINSDKNGILLKFNLYVYKQNDQKFTCSFRILICKTPKSMMQ